MRTLIRAGAVSAGLSAAFLLAPVAHATAPGDNGTVKIHDARTGEELRRNEPHVCSFYLDAFGFDGVQQVDWHIDVWAPTSGTKGETVKSGDITLDAKGHGRTKDMTLPDGHYKLFWNFDGEKGAAKHKVFWTYCEGSQGGGGSTPSASASPSSSASPSDTAGATASPSSSAGEGTVPSAGASPSAQGGGNLAETGSGAPVGLLSGAALAMVAAGGYLLLRRRTASRG
ncbi:LPXTG cell wall anchor domain-containing protein [Streptomyces sp. NPDC007264]|uniref:LPXTG cell wall anchor domain-containing protein n=1 Tax=Streptomyces sp. NPDC007264 TaxID=3364777 RepID=UPI0036D988CD